MQADAATERAKAAEHQTWREKQVANQLLQAGKDEVLEELREAQARMEEALEKATAAQLEKMKAENECWGRSYRLNGGTSGRRSRTATKPPAPS